MSTLQKINAILSLLAVALGKEVPQQGLDFTDADANECKQYVKFHN